MTWNEYNYAAFRRLVAMLRHYEEELVAVEEWLRKTGRHPRKDEIALQVEWGLYYTRNLLRTAEHLGECYRPKPYRPGVDPWKTRGLSAQLKPDFAARGITEIQPDELPSPPELPAVPRRKNFTDSTESPPSITGEERP